MSAGDSRGEDCTMLRGCRTLDECENILRSLVRPGTMLCDIELSESDLHFLEKLLKEFASNSSKKLADEIFDRFPTCMAIYLVHIGRQEYKTGDLWTPVSSRLSISDSNELNKFGHRFKQFLKEHRLPVPEIESGDHLVATILFHGGIPRSCYDEFARKFIVPLAANYILDPCDADEVRATLSYIREDEFIWAKQESDEKRLRTSLKNCEKKIQILLQLRECCKMYSEYAAALEEFEDSNIDLSFEDIEAELALLSNEIQELSVKRASLLKQAADLKEIISDYNTALDQIFECEVVRDPEFPDEVKRLVEEKRLLENRRETLVRRLEEEARGFLTTESVKATIQVMSGFSFGVLPDRTDRGLPNKRTDKTRSRIRSVALVGINGIGLATTLVGAATSHVLVTGIGLSIVLAAVFFMSYAPLWQWIGQLQMLRRLRTALAQLPLTEEVGRKRPDDVIEIVRTLKDLATETDALDRDLCVCLERLHQVESAIRWCSSIICTHQSLPEPLETKELDDEKLIVASEIISRTIRDILELRSASQRADEQLRTRVEPELRTLDERLRDLQSRLQSVQHMVVTLGSGDYEAGLQVLKKRQKKAERVHSLREQLLTELPAKFTLDSLKLLVDRTSLLSDKLNEWLSIKSDLEKKIAFLVSKRTSLPYTPLRYLSEPIRRFILYGGDYADRLVMDALAYVKGMNHDRTSALPDLLIATLVKVSCECAKESGATGHFDRITSPSGPLDRAPKLGVEINDRDWTIDLNIGSAKFEFEGDVRSVNWVLRDDNGEVLGSCSPQVYLEGLDSFRIEPVTLSLTKPSSKYVLGLLINDRLVFSKEFNGVNELGLMVLSRDDKTLIRSDSSLPARVVWLIYDVRWELSCPESIVDTLPLRVSGETWHRFRCAGLDLRGCTELTFIDHLNGEQISLPVEKSRSGAEIRVCGRTVRGLSCDGCVVIVGSAVDVELIIPATSELSAWRITVRYVGFDRDYRSTRLDNLRRTDQSTDDRLIVRVPLFSSPVRMAPKSGLYSVLLINDRGVEETLSFYYLPGLDVRFDRDIYPLQEPGSYYTIRVHLSLPEGFTIDRSTEREWRQDASEFVREFRSDLIGSHIYFTLAILGNDSSLRKIPLEIEIPRLAYRVKIISNGRTDCGNGWTYEIGEMMVSDWTTAELVELVVRCPFNIDGVFRLAVAADGQCSEERHREDNLLHFDLLEFLDTLRSGNDLETIELVIRTPESTEYRYPLLWIRNRWKAEKPKVVYVGSTSSLQISWTDFGTATNRKLVLWSPLSSKNPVAMISVPDECSSVSFSASDIGSAGTFIATFYVDDGWSAIPSLPTGDESGLGEIQVIDVGDSVPFARVELGNDESQRTTLSVFSMIEGTDMSSVSLICLSVQGIEVATKLGDNVWVIGDRENACWALLVNDSSYQVHMILRLPDYNRPVCLLNSQISSAALRLKEILNPSVRLSDLSNGSCSWQCNNFTSINLMKLAESGNKQKSVDLEAIGRSRPIILDRSTTDPRLFRFQKGVLCTSCNQLVPDQATWHKEHHRCRGMRLEPEESRLKGELIYSYMDAVTRVVNEGFAQNHHLRQRLLTVYPAPVASQPDVSLIFRLVKRLANGEGNDFDLWRCAGMIASIELATLEKYALASGLIQ